MKKVLAITMIGIPLGCIGSFLMTAAICMALLYSCTNDVVQFVLNPAGTVVNVATAAVNLVSHLTGKFLNSYNVHDAALSGAISYWEKTCTNKDGSLCSGAQSGNLQCVEFVTGAFAMAHISLPYAHDAHYFWDDYSPKNLPANLQSDWREVPVGTGLPEPGDIVVWKSREYNRQTHQMEEGAGHVAIVVAVIPPLGGKAGQVYVAAANTTTNTTVGAALNTPILGGIFRGIMNLLGNTISNARLSTLTLHPDLTLDSSPDFTPLGYIRYLKQPIQGPQDMQSVMAKMPHIVERQWVPVAWADANKYGIPPNYFIKQIYLESQFDPNAISHDPKTGKPIAYGIAQFIPDTARGMGINAMDPTQALDASARLMRQYYCTYLGSGNCATLLRNSTAQARSTAYGKALAAYNGGPGVVTWAVANCGEANWFACLGSDVQSYLEIVAS